MAYWHRTAPHTFTPTEHVGGAWDLATQHIAPALGVLAHEVETDRDRRRQDGLVVSRLSYDIFGTVPIEPIDVSVEVLRPGRTIELVQATASHGGRTVVVLRAWLAEPYDTTPLAGTDLPSIPSADEMEPWDMAGLWRGGFIASLEVRRKELGPGRSMVWVRTPHALVADEPVSRLAAVAGLVDVTNGIAVRADPGEVAFPNLDLTAHFLHAPAEGWLGLDTTQSYGPGGIGVTSSKMHDEDGPLGTIAQTLTVRP
ncbi:acyl-CoA thioesterase [Nocardioides aromaticivorans]|uniref:Acyl-CoA thioesterase n=1 Tax=Nocardioides aromaticivorans TaxID=200618 RepID=A0A7Z0CM13_9ACTN|nr:thioesterase family protein [Nocardioides aromaticivorans]NYI46336.1 acyl-CoA thioesterase [Nocardioides aromaticivorans]